MKGDFTRFSHQPHRHYAGVLVQQGRVTLDADWNEQFDIDDHRWRIQTIDTIGRACAPEDAPGFGLSLTPDGSDLIISPGRIYVDGILVEIDDGPPVRVTEADAEVVTVRDLAPPGRPFEAGQWVAVASPRRDDVVARIGTVDAASARLELSEDVSAFGGDDDVTIRVLTTYLTQPYFPAGAPPPIGESFDPADWAGRTHLLYLDVWRRHVTAIEDPHLREVALGGPDTATRVQTVWSVRILRDGGRRDRPVDAGQVGCGGQLEQWDALVAPAAGRMSASAVAAADPDDPCAILPEAGYRGLENRLYRVEVHQPGALGQATFKWSSQNGSILSSIVDFPEVDEVEVHSLGKDKVLRFGADDRVEVLSDETEFAGRHGVTASIVGAPDEAERRITLDTDVSAFDGRTNPRLRRWDHGANEIPTAAGPIELELGVQVEFSEGPFRTGDYWVIPARVATGDVEGFIDAPPRGIDHHRARLALVTWQADDDGDILDCRHRFPPLCGLHVGGEHCCTVSVGEGGDVATLAGALDMVAELSGPARICILPGEHRLDAPALVRRGDLTIIGCGRRSRIVAAGSSAIVLRNVSDVRIEDLWIASASAEPTIDIIRSSQVELVDLRVVNGARRVADPVDDLNAPATHGFGRRAPVAPASEVFAATPASPSHPSDLVASPTGEPVARSAGPAVGSSDSSLLRIRTCVLRGLPSVDLQGEQLWVEQCVMTGGGVWLRDGTEAATIVGNTITRGHGQGVLLGGIRAGDDLVDTRTGLYRIRIVDNRIDAMAREGVSTALFSDDESLGDIDELTIADNEISRCGLAPPFEGLAFGGGIYVGDASAVRVHDNTVVDNGPPDRSAERFAIGFGVAVQMCVGLDVHHNRIERNGRTTGRNDESVTLNVGVAALGVLPSDAGGASGQILDGPAAAIHDNVLACDDGPGVLAFGIGPISIDDNTIVCHYPGRSLLDFGRAVLVADIGGPPDLLSVRFGRDKPISWEIRHGRVSLNGNQISVQARSDGLPIPPDLSADDAPIGELRVGSAVAAVSFDDLAIGANQVLNEIVPAGEGRGRIGSSVWAMASTLRSTTNRVTELAGTATRSYAGAAFAHHACDNTTTHCMRVDGARVVERDNIELLCLRFVPVPPAFHAFFGG